MAGMQGRIISSISNQKTLTNHESLKVGYALEVVKNEGIKTILLLAFFCWMGQLPAFALCMAISCTVRVFAGGTHMKTNIGCFAISFLMFSSEIMLLPNLPIELWAYNILLVSGILVICILSPLASYKRPFQGKDSKRYRLCKRNAIIFTLLWGVSLFLISDTFLKECGVWVIVLQALQMAITQTYRYFKETKEVLS